LGLGRVNPELVSLMNIDILAVIELYRLLQACWVDSSQGWSPGFPRPLHPSFIKLDKPAITKVGAVDD